MVDHCRFARSTASPQTQWQITQLQLDHPLPLQPLCHNLPPFPHRGVSLNVGRIPFFANILEFPDTIFPVVLEVANAGLYPSSRATTFKQKDKLQFYANSSKQLVSTPPPLYTCNCLVLRQITIPLMNDWC